MLCWMAGPICNETVDFCTPSHCLNSGDCQQKLGGYNCTCPAGFRGTNCEINHDDCDSGPCLNGGSCEDGIANFRYGLLQFLLCTIGITQTKCINTIKRAKKFNYVYVSIAR